jgi:hypothetical protein
MKLGKNFLFKKKLFFNIKYCDRFESDEEEKQQQRINDEDDDFYEPKKKKKRLSAKDDGDDQQYYSRLRDFYADQNAPSHSNKTENDDVEIGSGLWIPLSIWDRLFK